MNSSSRLLIPYRELSIGSHRFGFRVDDGFFAAFENSPVDGAKVSVEVTAQRKNSGMILNFSLEGTARVECDRCLEPLELLVEWEGELPVKVDDAREGEYDGEAIYISSGEESVDVSQWVYESICLSLPIIKVHEEDQNGVPKCDPDMLSRFKIVSQSDFDRITEDI